MFSQRRRAGKANLFSAFVGSQYSAATASTQAAAEPIAHLESYDPLETHGASLACKFSPGKDICNMFAWCRFFKYFITLLPHHHHCCCCCYNYCHLWIVCLHSQFTHNPSPVSIIGIWNPLSSHRRRHLFCFRITAWRGDLWMSGALHF